ncbi:MAG TPA: universal stress protein [Propionibacteriaceae bacterium]|nr:universal stress protein [Propionibacteriaceae bacterium]
MRNQIVVGLDDSPSGKAGLQWAAEQASSVGAVLRAVHALGRQYGFAAPDIPLTIEPTELTPEEPLDARRNAITRIFEAVSPHRDWVLEFVSGYAGEVLVRLSKDAQLLVVGTREHVGLGRVLAGSVSHYCLSHAVCPVVAVPAPAHDVPVGNVEKEQSEQTAAAVAAETESSEEKKVRAEERRRDLAPGG